METYRELDEISKNILVEIGNIGAGNAVTSLSQMIDQPIELEIPALKVLSYQEICRVLGQPEELQTGILVEATGQMKGIFLFILSETFTNAVIEAILGRRVQRIMEMDEMETSPVCELGNIMCGSYIRALPQFMNIEMDVSVLEPCIDMAGAIPSYSLSHWVIVSDNILLTKNWFQMSGKIYRGYILFLPEQEDLGIMLHGLREQRHGQDCSWDCR